MNSTLKSIILVIWVFDIFNFSTNINGFDTQVFLDVNFPINTLWWFIVWILVSMVDND